jgi:hypothetical protein
LCTRSGVPTIVPTVCRGFSELYGSWKIIWISLRSGSICRFDSWPISRPSNIIDPPSGRRAG